MLAERGATFARQARCEDPLGTTLRANHRVSHTIVREHTDGRVPSMNMYDTALSRPEIGRPYKSVDEYLASIISIMMWKRKEVGHGLLISLRQHRTYRSWRSRCRGALAASARTTAQVVLQLQTVGVRGRWRA